MNPASGSSRVDGERAVRRRRLADGRGEEEVVAVGRASPGSGRHQRAASLASSIAATTVAMNFGPDDVPAHRGERAR